MGTMKKHKKTYIYGAGKLGQWTLESLKSLNIGVDAFVDPKQSGISVKGVPVIDLEQVVAGSKVYVAVLNNFVSLREIKEKLMSQGVEIFATPPELFFELGENGLHANWYWLDTDRNKVLNLAEQARELLIPILDKTARENLENILNYRTLGNIDEHLILPESEQYFSTSIPNFWKGDVSLVDAGAYTGDTIANLLSKGINLDSLYAFEPDPVSFSKLQSGISKNIQNAITLQAALGSKNRIVKMDLTGSSGSVITNGDGTLVPEYSFDLTFPSASISHIKLDVEGAELDVLKGLTTTISRCSPSLAVSVYHKPDDLVTLTKYILEFACYSRFDLRTFANQSFETIFYASK